MTKPVIIIPAYQAAGTISETLASILHQGTALNRVGSVIVADDASRDDTVAVARGIWNGAVPLRVLTAEVNRGEGATLSRAINGLGSEVKWFLVLHADDVAKVGWLDRMCDRIEAADERVASICSSWDQWYPADGRVIPGENAIPPDVRLIAGGSDAVRGTLQAGTWWHISGCALRVADYLAVGGRPPDLPQKGDWELLLRLLTRGRAIEYIPLSLIKYRQSAASVSSSSFRTHADIAESLGIVRRYRWALTPSRVTRMHAQYLSWLARRACRSFLRGQWARGGHAFRVGWAVALNWATCQFARRDTNPHNLAP